jgi:hypothetical protein
LRPRRENGRTSVLTQTHTRHRHTDDEDGINNSLKGMFGRVMVKNIVVGYGP